MMFKISEIWIFVKSFVQPAKLLSKKCLGVGMFVDRSDTLSDTRFDLIHADCQIDCIFQTHTYANETVETH